MTTVAESPETVVERIGEELAAALGVVLPHRAGRALRAVCPLRACMADDCQLRTFTVDRSAGHAPQRRSQPSTPARDDLPATRHPLPAPTIIRRSLLRLILRHRRPLHGDHRGHQRAQ